MKKCLWYRYFKKIDKFLTPSQRLVINNGRVAKQFKRWASMINLEKRENIKVHSVVLNKNLLGYNSMNYTYRMWSMENLICFNSECEQCYLHLGMPISDSYDIFFPGFSIIHHTYLVFKLKSCVITHLLNVSFGIRKRTSLILPDLLFQKGPTNLVLPE